MAEPQQHPLGSTEQRFEPTTAPPEASPPELSALPVGRAVRAALAADRVLFLAAHLMAVVIGARNLDGASFGRFLFGLAVAVVVAGAIGAAADRSALAAGEMPGPGRASAAASILAVIVVGLSAASLGAPTWVVSVPVAVAMAVVGRLRHLSLGDGRYALLLLADLAWLGAGVAVLLVDDIGADLVAFDLETDRGYLVLWALGPCLSILVFTAALDEVASGEAWFGPTWAWFLADHLLPVGALAMAGIGVGVALSDEEFAALAVAVALFAPVAALLALGSTRTVSAVIASVFPAAVPTGSGFAIESTPDRLTRARQVATGGVLGAFALVLLPEPWTVEVVAGHRPDPMVMAVVGLAATVWAAARSLSGRRIPGPIPPRVWTGEAVAVTGAGVASVVMAELLDSAFASVLPMLAVGFWLALIQLRELLYPDVALAT